MLNLLKAELFKIKFDRLLLILSLMLLAVGLNNFGLQNQASGRAAFLADTKDFVALLACAAYAGMSIGGDFAKRTLHKLVMAGHSRISILICKLVSYFIGCVYLYALCTLVSCIPYIISKGWGVPFTMSEMRMVLSTFALSLILHLCMTGIVFFIAFWIKETGIATVICLFIMLIIVITLDSGSTTNGLVAYALSGGDALPTGVIIRMWGIALFALAGSTSFSYLTFRKVELK